MALTQVYGLIGSPVGHTLGPIMHDTAFKELGLNCIYHAFSVGKENAERAIKGALALGFGGLNVTIPLKELALQYITPDTWARRIGAINTIDSKGNGYNTDGTGAVRAFISPALSNIAYLLIVVMMAMAFRQRRRRLTSQGR